MRVVNRLVMACVAAAVGLAAPAAWASVSPNLVKNPSFEEHSASSRQYNMDNATATATIDYFTAFGHGGGASDGEIDLTVGSSYFGTPEHGNSFVTLHTSTSSSGNQDAFAIELIESLVVGHVYELSFFAHCGPDGSRGVEAGISTSATGFGTQIFSASAYSNQKSVWTQLSGQFTATIPATHLTFQSAYSGNSQASLDNVRLELVPEPASIILLLGASLLLLRR